MAYTSPVVQTLGTSNIQVNAPVSTSGFWLYLETWLAVALLLVAVIAPEPDATSTLA